MCCGRIITFRRTKKEQARKPDLFYMRSTKRIILNSQRCYIMLSSRVPSNFIGVLNILAKNIGN